MNELGQEEMPDETVAPEPRRRLFAALFHGAPESTTEPAEEAEAVEAVVEFEEPAEVAEPAEPKRSSGWVVMSVLSVMIGIMVGLAVVGYMKYVDGPVEAKPVNSLAQVEKSTAPKPVQPNFLSGLAIEFQYPAVFDMVGQVKTDAQATEQYNIGSKSDYSRTIAVSVRALPSGHLEDDSGYRFRQLSTSDYHQVTDNVRGEPAAVFAKSDKHEQTLFWPHQGKEVTISITSNNPKDDLTVMMQGIVKTLRWRQ